MTIAESIHKDPKYYSIADFMNAARRLKPKVLYSPSEGEVLEFEDGSKFKWRKGQFTVHKD